MITGSTHAAKLLQESIEGIVAFYLLREQEKGGFSAGRYMPATVEDTYHALRCLHAVAMQNSCTDESGIKESWKFQGNVPISLHMNFIAGKLSKEWSNSKRLFQLLWCGQALQKSAGKQSDILMPQRESIISFLQKRASERGTVDEIFYAVRLFKLLFSTVLPPLDNFSNRTDFSVKSVSELKMTLYMLMETGSALESLYIEKWKQWLSKCRNDDGGYGFFSGTTSYTENIYHALQSYRILGARPEAMDETTGFLRACRSRRGGFGRRCEGIPFPDSTWYATASLIELASLIDNA